jgi:hypothetical protein
MEMIDTDLLPESDDMYGKGICVRMLGEPGDKHPHMRMYFEESEMPVLRQVWEQGRMVEYFLTIQAAMDRGNMMNPDQLWEHLLSLDNDYGRHCRMIESGYFAMEGGTQL